jgi:hypothetical protein
MTDSGAGAFKSAPRTEFDRVLGETIAGLRAAMRQHAASGELFGARTDGEQLAGMLIPEGWQVEMSIPRELLMDWGVIPDTRPAPAPPSRRERFRWWIAGSRERAAELAYRLIAGFGVPEPRQP